MQSVPVRKALELWGMDSYACDWKEAVRREMRRAEGEGREGQTRSCYPK